MKTTTWLQLLRAPNLFTVPGDPIAGFLLASTAAPGFPARLVLPIWASLCFYAAGLLLNDLMDLEEDRRERPNRPLPSGAARPIHVWVAAGALTALGLSFCAAGGTRALAIGIGIVIAVATYDCGLKNIPVLGAITMGMCRGGSILLGAAFAGGFAWPALAASISITVYIAGVTHLARYETTAGAPPYVIVLPALGPVAMIALSPPSNLLNASAFLIVTGMVAMMIVKVWKKRMPLPPAIGALIRILLIIQAFYCLSAIPSVASLASACLLFAVWPLSRMVSKRFYAS